MKTSLVSIATLFLAGLTTPLVAAGCGASPEPQAEEPVSAAQEAMAADPEDPGDPTDPTGGYPGDTECALRAAACVVGVVAIEPACVPACATIVGCIPCAGATLGTITACRSWLQDCSSRAATPGESCTTATRCETGSLHCVDGTCRQARGNENQGCTTERDCQDGLRCQNGPGDSRFCWRPRQAGESCSAGDCAFTDSEGHSLTCNPDTHRCTRTDACSNHQQCGVGNYCNNGFCAHGCLDNSQCAPGDECVAGGCTHTEVIICNCDGTDAPGTCIDACGGGGGGGGWSGDPWGSGWGWGVTCYNYYDTYTVCAEYNGQQDCDTYYELTDSFCI